MKIAVLDLGTNVFNLLLAEISKDKCHIIREFKSPARLGDGGLSSGVLSDNAFSSAHEALYKIMSEIEREGGVENIYAFATSAVRDAKNGKEFAESIKLKFGIEIQIISGDREAELIYKGIREAMFIYDEVVLMLDIGGGSNEFILANKNEILWKKSYPLGMARLKERFMPSEPISTSQIKEVEQFIEESLQDLWAVVETYKPSLLVGSSGSFDTIRDLLSSGDDDKSLPAKEIPLSDFETLHQRLLSSTTEQRKQMPGMSMIRIDFIVLASIFINKVKDRCGFKEIYQSSFSLKEGVMAEKYRELTEN